MNENNDWEAVMYIIKRNGKKVPFNKEKIYNAICEANECVKSNHKLTKAKIREITDNIVDIYEKGNCSKSVEAVQDMVEEALVDTGAYGVAKEYITYRYKRSLARGFGENFLIEITKKLKADDVQNQNANVDEHSFGGRVGEASSVMTKKFALDTLVSKMARDNHLNNEIYIHDLDSYAVGMHNCLSVPFDKILASGFNTRQTDVRPAGSVNTAFQLVAVVFQLQSLQQFGGVSATHLDWTMVPYVRKSFAKHYKDGLKYICGLNFNIEDILEDINHDEQTNHKLEDIRIDDYSIYQNDVDDAGDFDKAYNYAMDMTKREIHQAVEGLYHNLNTLQSRSGNQLKWMAG